MTSSSNLALVAKSARRRGFRLTEDDVEILRLIYHYRFLTIRHLMALTKRSYVPIHRRVLGLTRQGFLSRIDRRWEAHIYAVGKRGVAVLVERGIAPIELLSWRPRHSELKELFLKHELMVVDFHVVLELATRASDIRLVKWQEEGPSIFDRVWVSENGSRRRLPVRPDALFVLEDSRRPTGQNKATFLLEADRSTTTHKRFGQKLRAYWEWFQKGLHREKFGVRKFRVVTVTLTRERAWNLCEAAAELLPSGRARQMFLFTSVQSFSLGNPGPIFGDVFIRPGNFREGVRHRLVPPVVEPVEGRAVLAT